MHSYRDIFGWGFWLAILFALGCAGYAFVTTTLYLNRSNAYLGTIGDMRRIRDAVEDYLFDYAEFLPTEPNLMLSEERLQTRVIDPMKAFNRDCTTNPVHYFLLLFVPIESVAVFGLMVIIAGGCLLQMRRKKRRHRPRDQAIRFLKYFTPFGIIGASLIGLFGLKNYERQVRWVAPPYCPGNYTKYEWKQEEMAYFYASEQGQYLLVSVGPDGDLDFTEFEEYAVKAGDLLDDLGPIAHHLYDPTNGTISSGDIMSANGVWVMPHWSPRDAGESEMP